MSRRKEVQSPRREQHSKNPSPQPGREPARRWYETIRFRTLFFVSVYAATTYLIKVYGV